MTTTDRLASALAGAHFVEHSPGVGEHVELSPRAAAHLADVVREALWIKSEDDIRADERERIAERLDSEGHHWSGEPARHYFRAADLVREADTANGAIQ